MFYFSVDWFLIILNLFFIYKVVSILKENINERNKYALRTYSVMKWYPTLQVFCSLPATVNRFYDIYTKEINFELMMLQAVFDCIGGFLVTIVFLFSPKIKNSLKICCNKLLGGFKKRAKSNETIKGRKFANSITTSDYTLNSDIEDRTSSFINIENKQLNKK